MKKSKILLVISLLTNLCLAWILYIDNKRSIRLNNIGGFHVGKTAQIISAHGALSPVNYTNNDIIYVDIKCYLDKNVCRFANISGDLEGRFMLAQDYQNILSFDGRQLILENNDPSCRKEVWKIDLVGKMIYMDSYPKDLKDQVDDCSYMERKILSSKFISFYDRKIQLGKR